MSVIFSDNVPMRKVVTYAFGGALHSPMHTVYVTFR